MGVIIRIYVVLTYALLPRVIKTNQVNKIIIAFRSVKKNKNCFY